MKKFIAAVITALALAGAGSPLIAHASTAPASSHGTCAHASHGTCSRHSNP